MCNTGSTAALTLTQAHAALAREMAAHAQTAALHAHERDAHARESAEHVETRSRLAYRESARGWLRFPFAAVRQRMAARR